MGKDREEERRELGRGRKGRKGMKRTGENTTLVLALSPKAGSFGSTGQLPESWISSP